MPTGTSSASVRRCLDPVSLGPISAPLLWTFGVTPAPSDLAGLAGALPPPSLVECGMFWLGYDVFAELAGTMREVKDAPKMEERRVGKVVG
jgi:hypothetical protein